MDSKMLFEWSEEDKRLIRASEFEFPWPPWWPTTVDDLLSPKTAEQRLELVHWWNAVAEERARRNRVLTKKQLRLASYNLALVVSLGV
jgi:hypothetical protein